MAGVSPKTIGRIERGQDYDDPRSLPRVRAALGLDGQIDLSTVPGENLVAEMLRRVVAADRIIEQARIWQGDAPPDLLDRPDTLRGPKREQPPKGGGAER